MLCLKETRVECDGATGISRGLLGGRVSPGNVYKLVGEALVTDYLEGYRLINHSEVRTITLI